MVCSAWRWTHGLLVRVFRGHEAVGWWRGGHVNVPCTSSATCCYAARETKVLHEWVAHNRGEFEKTVCCGMEKISCHTGTIDAAWSAVTDFIPNSLRSKSKDLFLYVKCWLWRYVNLHTHLQQKTISTRKRLLWKQRKKKPVNMLQWNESKTCTKRKICQILAREFGTNRLAEIPVSLWQKSFFLKTLFLRARFPVRRDVYDPYCLYTIMHSCIYKYNSIYRYAYINM